MKKIQILIKTKCQRVRDKYPKDVGLTAIGDVMDPDCLLSVEFQEGPLKLMGQYLKQQMEYKLQHTCTRNRWNSQLRRFRPNLKF